MLTGQSALNHYQQFARLEKTVLHKVNGVDVKTLRERLLTQKYDIENALQTAKGNVYLDKRVGTTSQLVRPANLECVLNIK